MFICSVKMSKRKLILIGAAILLAILIAVGASFAGRSAPDYAGGDNAARAAFLSSFGWTGSEEPVEEAEVAIPAEFTDVYKGYNALQQSQGFDLTPYKGETVLRYTYNISNYEGQPDMQAHILVYDGRIIGGDLCSPQLDGVMCGFSGEPWSS